MAMEKVQEIQARINGLKTSFKDHKKKIEELRTQRAQLATREHDVKDVHRLDIALCKLQLEIDNYPFTLKELERQLNEEQQRVTQEEQNRLIEQQQKAAEDVECLSKKFIMMLEKVVEINESLIAAISAEANLRQKTGKQLLTEYCDGSRGSLAALLEKSQMEIDGSHGTMLSPGQEIRILL